MTQEELNKMDAAVKIEKDLSTKQDASIQKGLTAIQRGDYSVLENTRCLGTYVVNNSETGYSGLITESGEEILPCIFDSVKVSLDGIIEVRYMGLYMEPTHNFKLCDKSIALEWANDDDNGFTFGENGGFLLLGRRRMR